MWSLPQNDCRSRAYLGEMFPAYSGLHQRLGHCDEVDRNFGRKPIFIRSSPGLDVSEMMVHRQKVRANVDNHQIAERASRALKIVFRGGHELAAQAHFL